MLEIDLELIAADVRNEEAAYTLLKEAKKQGTRSYRYVDSYIGKPSQSLLEEELPIFIKKGADASIFLELLEGAWMYEDAAHYIDARLSGSEISRGERKYLEELQLTYRNLAPIAYQVRLSRRWQLKNWIYTKMFNTVEYVRSIFDKIL